MGFRRRHQPPPGPVKQREAELPFQLLDRLADTRLRDMQHLGSALGGSVDHDSVKDLHLS